MAEKKPKKYWVPAYTAKHGAAWRTEEEIYTGLKEAWGYSDAEAKAKTKKLIEDYEAGRVWDPDKVWVDPSGNRVRHTDQLSQGETAELPGTEPIGGGMAQITVQKGDSLWKIAKRVKPTGVSTEAFVKQMVEANPELKDPDKIKPGMVLVAPGAKEPPTPRSRPGRDQEPMPFASGMGVPPAPADLQRGVEPVHNEVIVGRNGEISARMGTEQFGPAGSPMDRQAAMLEIARRQELTRRAAVQQDVSLAEVMRQRGYKNVTETMAVPTSGTDPDLVPGPLEGGPLLQRNPPLPGPKDVYRSQAMTLPSMGDRGNFTLGDPAGLLEEGNVDLSKRPRIPNPDGTFSSILSKSFELLGKQVLIPTMGPEGELLKDEEAVNRFLDTGEHLGAFKSPEAATAYAQRLNLGLGGPTHDPDAFVDMGSPRWTEITNARIDAQQGINKRKGLATMKVPVSAKVRTPVVPTAQGLDQLSAFMGRAGQVGSMGGGNASK